MARIQEKIELGDKINVRTMPGKEDTVISRLPSGRVVLFDKNSQYFNLLAPGQSVECHVIYIQENFIIVDPISEPEEISKAKKKEFIRIPESPEIYVEDIVEELEKLVEKVSGNAKVIPRALLKIIRLEQKVVRLEQLMIRILIDEA